MIETSTILGSITGNEISVIKDPFNKHCTGDIRINYWSDLKKPYWKATIEFKNGNTKGEQSTPQCATFEEVITHLKIILDQIESKP